MYQRQELFANVSPEDMPSTLNACALPEKEEYTDDEGDRLRECLVLREQGKSYDEIAQMFQQNGLFLSREHQSSEVEPQQKGKKTKNGRKPAPKPLDFIELLSCAKELLGTGIPPKEAIKLLETCGLSADAEQYSQPECDRFLEACDLHKNQGKTHTEISAHFGLSLEAPETDLLQQVDDATDLIQEEVSAATDEMVQQKAEEHALNDYRRYVGHYAQALRSGRKVQEFLNDFRSYSKDRLEGKPQQVRLKSATPILILPSDTTSMNSSENSSNGMTNE